MATCRQCGAKNPNSMWKICAACQKKNVEYERECTLLSRALRHEFATHPPTTAEASRGPVQPFEKRRPAPPHRKKGKEKT